MKMVNAQMMGPARMMMATTTIHVGKSCFVSDDKGVLSSSGGSVADSRAGLQEPRHARYRSVHTTEAHLTNDGTTPTIPGTLMWRIAAHVIDIAVLFALFIVVWSVAAAFVSLSLVPYVNTAIVLAYAAGFEAMRGRTLGKQALRLQVHNQNGTYPTLGQALRRNLYFALALLPGFIGGIVAISVIGWIAASILVDVASRQGVHDRFARETFVTRHPRPRT